MRRLKAERSVGVPEITPEALSAYFGLIKKQINSAIQREELLTAKKLIAQFVSKIEIAKDKAIIHYTFPTGIPSRQRAPNQRPQSTAIVGLFFFVTDREFERSASAQKTHGLRNFFFLQTLFPNYLHIGSNSL